MLGAIHPRIKISNGLGNLTLGGTAMAEVSKENTAPTGSTNEEGLKKFPTACRKVRVWPANNPEFEGFVI